MSIHFVCNKCKATSSVAVLPILPNISITTTIKSPRLFCCLQDHRCSHVLDNNVEVDDAEN